MRYLLIVPILMMATPVHAQLCAGNPSFAAGPIQVGAAATFTDGANAIEGSFGVGQDRGLFGGVGVGRTSFSDIDESSTSFRITAGFDGRADRAGKVHLCPTGTLSFGFGPDEDPVTLRTLGVGGGLSLGFVAADTDGIAVVPTVGGGIQYARVTLDIDDIGDESDSETYGILTFGVGFVFNERVALTPGVVVPIGLEGSDPSFRIAFSLNFGR